MNKNIHNNKITIKVMIENDQIYTEEYVIDQPINVIINKSKANFSLKGEERILRREDGTPLTDLHQKIENAGIRDGETLRFFAPSPKPDDRNKGFA